MSTRYPASLPAFRLLAAAGFAVLLGGCSFWGGDDDNTEECVAEEEYQAAQTAQDLTVPANFDRPDPSVRLNVPEGPLPAEPLARNAACLQRPPSYFDKPLTTPEPLPPPPAN